jgi:uncharacterized tellurite resistance protein B-like protein
MIDHEKALAYFQNLYLVAVADEILAKEETSFLVEVSKVMGISARETMQIMSNSKNLDLVIPDTEEEKMIQLEDIITMMIVDRKIHEKEYNLCLRFAEHIGLNKIILDRTIFKVVRGE